MAIGIRRCLFIGLGGTGMDALLHTKKLFMETYGEVPPMIGFLGIDTNRNQYNVSLDSSVGKIELVNSEQYAILPNNPMPTYNANKSHFNWLPDSNIVSLTTLNGAGAGQVRTNGRFCLTQHFGHLKNKIRNAVTAITNASIINNEKYKLLSNNVEIHLVFSVCGGTGAGTFINLAYLIKNLFPQYKLACYAVLPDVFNVMDPNGMGRVKPNAYSAINSLDFLVHRDPTHALKMDYITQEETYYGRPFDAFMFIDNRNENGDTYTHVSQLSEMIALALITATGELSNAIAGTMDNIIRAIGDGNCDVQDKRAWVAGMGVCKITYRGDKLSKIYSHKATKRIIERLQNSCNDTDQIVNNWIDTQCIRENNGRNDVIDAIISADPQYEFNDISDNQEALTEVNQYITNQMPDENSIHAAINQMTTSIKTSLRTLVIDSVNRECGITDTENLLTGIQAQVGLFLDEMNKELNDEQKKENVYKASLETATKELAEYDNKFLKTKGGVNERKASVYDATRALIVCKREIERRKAAIRFYNELEAQINSELNHILAIKENLRTVTKDIVTEISKVQNCFGEVNKYFEIDMAIEQSKQIVVCDDDLNIGQAINNLGFSNKVYDFADPANIEAIKTQLLAFTENLIVAKKLKETSVETVLRDLAPNELESVIERALRKSAPLLTLDYDGHIPLSEPSDIYYVGVPNNKDSILIKDDKLKKSITGRTPSIDFASIGMKDSIIIYRQIAVAPAFTISSYRSYKQEDDKLKRLNSSNYTGIDYAITQSMNREGFSIYPSQIADNTLELWVKGFIYGRLKNDGEMYYIYDEENGDPLDDYWVELKKYRDEAYAEFSRLKPTIENYLMNYFLEEEERVGTDAKKEKIQDVKSNYLEKYAQVKMSKEALRQKGYESIAAQVRKEIEFVKKELA